jgi:hypothetical protein
MWKWLREERTGDPLRWHDKTLEPDLLRWKENHDNNTYLKYYKVVAVHNVPIPVAARSKAWVYGRSIAGIVGSNPTGDMDVCLLGVLCVVR